MALKTHPKGSEGVYEDNLPWVMGLEVEIKKAKRYEDQLGLKLEQQPFPGNGARKLVGYFNNCE